MRNSGGVRTEAAQLQGLPPDCFVGGGAASYLRVRIEV